MAYQKNIFHIKCDASKSAFIDQQNSGINPPDGYEGRIPDLVVNQSFRLILECYDDYDVVDDAAKRSNFDSTTAAMVIKRRNSTQPGTDLVTGVAVATDGTNSEYNTYTLDCPKDTISDVYDGKACTIEITITGASGKNVFLQQLNVISSDGTGDNDIDTSDIEESTYQVVASTTAPDADLDTADGYRIGDYVWHISGTQLYRCDDASAAAAVWTAVSTFDAWPGHITYLLDTTAGHLTATLPANGAKDTQYITLAKIAAANTATIGNTVNGDAAPKLYSLQAVDVIDHAGAWISPHYSKFL